MKLDGTRAETRFGLSAKRTSPFKLAGASVQSTTGSRGVRISGSNAGYTMFWGRVQDYWLHTPVACSPFTSPTVCHRVPSGFNWALLHEHLCVFITAIDSFKLWELETIWSSRTRGAASIVWVQLLPFISDCCLKITDVLKSPSCKVTTMTPVCPWQLYTSMISFPYRQLIHFASTYHSFTTQTDGSKWDILYKVCVFVYSFAVISVRWYSEASYTLHRNQKWDKRFYALHTEKRTKRNKMVTLSSCW